MILIKKKNNCALIQGQLLIYNHFQEIFDINFDKIYHILFFIIKLFFIILKNIKNIIIKI